MCIQLDLNGPRSYQVPCGASVSRRVFSLVLRLIGACHCTRQAPPPHSPRALAQGWAHGIPIGIAVHRYTPHKLLLQPVAAPIPAHSTRDRVSQTYHVARCAFALDPLSLALLLLDSPFLRITES